MIGFWENWAKSMHFTGHYTYSVWIITVGHWIFAAQECLISNHNNNWSAIQPAKEIRSSYNHAFCGCAFLAYQLAVFTSFAIASKFNVNNYGSILAWTLSFFSPFLFYLFIIIIIIIIIYLFFFFFFFNWAFFFSFVPFSFSSL